MVFSGSGRRNCDRIWGQGKTFRHVFLAGRYPWNYTGDGCGAVAVPVCSFPVENFGLLRSVAMQTEGMGTFESAREFCKVMCTDPICPDYPVYGSNNWYYAYGDSSEKEILQDTDYIVKLNQRSGQSAVHGDR